jgi:hypothetical protein
VAAVALTALAAMILAGSLVLYALTQPVHLCVWLSTDRPA